MLCDLLETGLAGTPVLNVALLPGHVPGCSVTIASASLGDLARWVEDRHPPIVLVGTGPLSSWQIECLHALVVVGIEEQTILVNDPAAGSGPSSIPRAEFLAAWGELAQLTAVIEVSRADRE